MYDILPKIEAKFSTILYVAFIGKLSQEEEVTKLSGTSVYAILLETIHDVNYKDAFGWFETTVMIHAYCKEKINGDNGSKWLQTEIKRVLDEEDLSDTEVLSSMLRYQSRSECEYNKSVGAWVQASVYIVRWKLK